MKKKAAAILITAMALNLVACSSSNTSNTTTAGQDTAAAKMQIPRKQLRKGTARRQRERDLRLHFLCTKTPIHLPHISVLD